MNYKDAHTNRSVIPLRHAIRWAFTKLPRKVYWNGGYKICGQDDENAMSPRKSNPLKVYLGWVYLVLPIFSAFY